MSHPFLRLLRGMEERGIVGANNFGEFVVALSARDVSTSLSNPIYVSRTNC